MSLVRQGTRRERRAAMKTDIVWIREGLPRVSEIGYDKFEECWNKLYYYFQRHPGKFRLEYPGRVSGYRLTKP